MHLHSSQEIVKEWFLSTVKGYEFISHSGYFRCLWEVWFRDTMLFKNRKIFLVCFPCPLAWSLFRVCLLKFCTKISCSFSNAIYWNRSMASKVALLKWLSVLNVAHALLVLILGIASINVTDFYVGFFGMGIWLGGLVSVSLTNRSRVQTPCNCFCYLMLRICCKNMCPVWMCFKVLVFISRQHSIVKRIIPFRRLAQFLSKNLLLM